MHQNGNFCSSKGSIKKMTAVYMPRKIFVIYVSNKGLVSTNIKNIKVNRRQKTQFQHIFEQTFHKRRYKMAIKHMQRRSTSLVCRAAHTTNTDKMTKTGGNAKQTDFLHIANRNAKWHNTLENSEAFFLSSEIYF